MAVVNRLSFEGHSLDNDKKLDFAAKTLDRILGFFSRVDGRAQLLMGIDVAMLYALAVNVPDFLGPWWADAAFIVAGVLLCVSLFRIYKVFFPQLAGPELSLVYFQEIRKLHQAEYVNRFTMQTPEGHIKDVLGQVWRNSEILSGKFRNLRDAMLFAAAALPFWILALAFAAVTKGPLILK